MRAHMISMMVLAAFLSVASTAVAQPTGNVTFGSQWWNQSVDEAKLQEFRVIPKGGFLESYFLSQSKGNVSANLWGSNALEDDQRHNLSLTNGLKWRVDAEVSGTPHVYSMTARSPLVQVSPGVFVLPDTLQRVMQNYLNQGNSAGTNAYTAALRDLLAKAPGVGLGIQTNVQKLRMRARQGKEWSFDVSAVRRDRQGSLAFGVPFGIGSATMTEVAAPIDQEMVDADATASWAKGRHKLMASAGLSTFQNDISTMRVDNSRRLTDQTTGTNSGTAAAQLDLWPDNTVMRGRVAYSAQLPKASTFTATVGVSQAKQDDAFLPYTSNTAIAYSRLDSLPEKKVEAEVQTLVTDFRLTGRPAAKLFGTVRFHSETNDNKTPVIEFQGFSPYDQTFSVGTIENEEWGMNSTNLGLDLSYELSSRADLTLLGEHKTREHKLREVEKDAENVFGVGLRLRPLDDVDVTANWRMGQRRFDSLNEEDYENAAGVFVEPSGLQRYDVADRDQNSATGAVSWAPNAKFDVTVSSTWTKDDYKDATYGLQKAENAMVFVDGTLRMTKTLDVTGGYGFGQLISTMASNEVSAAARYDTLFTTNWWMNERDRNVYVFANAEWRMKPKFTWKVDYTLSRSMNEYDFNAVRIAPRVAPVVQPAAFVPAQDVPNTFYRTHDVTLEARWKWSAQMDLACQFQYVQFDVADFAVEDAPLVGGSLSGTTFTPNAIYLGDWYHDFTARRVAFVATRRF
ncbi:MAG: MtrB/PioB family outer membrane beta-barrel protein [Candidatus Eisenbacteria bacterium]